jgi:hypothetical protein
MPTIYVYVFRKDFQDEASWLSPADKIQFPREFCHENYDLLVKEYKKFYPRDRIILAPTEEHLRDVEDSKVLRTITDYNFFPDEKIMRLIEW